MLDQTELSYILGKTAAPVPPKETSGVVHLAPQPPAPAQEAEIVPLSVRVREKAKRAGVDIDKLGINVAEFDYLVKGSEFPGASPGPASFAGATSDGSSLAAQITPAGTFVAKDSLDSTKSSFLETVADTAVEFGKGLVTDVLDGVSGYVDLFGNSFENIDLERQKILALRAIAADPNDLAARAQLRGLREQADNLEKEQLSNLWDVGTAAAAFAPFGGPVKMSASALSRMGMKEAAGATLAAMEARGVTGVMVRLADRAGKGAAMGGTYGFMASEGDLEQSKQSAILMSSLFGVGPAVAAPLKSAFGAAGKGTGRMVDAFSQLPPVAKVRKDIYNSGIGKAWDFMATRSEKIYEQFKLAPLITNMHVARIEAVRLGGKWVAPMTKNLDKLTPDDHQNIAALLERRMTPSQLTATLGAEKAAPLIRAAADESRRLKVVGRMLQAWGVPVHNSATGELYNFVMRKNYMPHIIVNPEKLLTDPALRSQSIAAIAKRSGKSLPEAEADFLQWAERAKADAANEATSGAIGRATLEARLYGLPGYSMDLPNVLNLYYQKAARQLAFHRRFGRHVTDANAWGPGDDAAAAMGGGPKTPVGGTPSAPGQQVDLFSEAPGDPFAMAAGDKVVIAGTKRPLKGTIVNPVPNAQGQVKVRVGKKGESSSKVLTVSGSKVTKRAVPAPAKAAEQPLRTEVPQMVARAVRLSDGTIETGSWHGEIYDRLGSRATDIVEDGYVDVAGKFYNRSSAEFRDMNPAQLRKELKGLGYSAKEIGAIIKGIKESAAEQAGPPPPPDPTQYVPPPPRRAAKKKGELEVQETVAGVRLSTGQAIAVARLRAQGMTPKEAVAQVLGKKPRDKRSATRNIVKREIKRKAS